MRKPVTLLVVLGLIAFLVFAAWVVSTRVDGLPPIPSPFFAETPRGTDSDLPVLSDGMPEFAGIEAWLNGEALSQADLRGKVVLIDFWTYSCINCIRTLPYVTAWHEKYKDKDFTVIGVHTPEFAFEKEEENVREATLRHGITYPVALDNEYDTWNAYSNHYWPAHYLFDAEGRLRDTHFGEGKYEETERNIQALLKEAGATGTVPAGTVPVAATTDFSRIGTRETYLGYGRMELLGSPEDVRRDSTQTYSVPKTPVLNLFYLAGDWRIEEERAVPVKAGARLIYRYKAAKANLVLGAEDGPAVRVDVLVGGKPVPKALRGTDLNYGEDGSTYLLVQEERLYEITDGGSDYGEKLLELKFIEPGAAAYAFTFG